MSLKFGVQMYNSKTLRLRNFVKRRSLIWKRSWLPMGDDATGIPRAGNGTVSRSSAVVSVSTNAQDCRFPILFFKYGKKLRGSSRYASA